MPWIRRSCTSEKSRFWCSGLQRLISSIKHRFRAPHGRRRLKEPDAGVVLVRVREADEVVEGNEARVVVTVLEPQRLGERVEQEGLARAGGADKQQGIFRDERREDQGLDGIEAVHPEAGEAGEFRWDRGPHPLPRKPNCHCNLLSASGTPGE